MENLLMDHCLLKKVEKQEKEAEAFGFYWENLEQILDQIRSECDEVKEAAESCKKELLEEEIGDLIQAAISVAAFCNLDPHKVLSKSIEKFDRRYQTVVEMARQDGFSTLHGEPNKVLMNYWNRAKSICDS